VQKEPLLEQLFLFLNHMVTLPAAITANLLQDFKESCLTASKAAEFLFLPVSVATSKVGLRCLIQTLFELP
jgi:hypothetical protein